MADNGLINIEPTDNVDISKIMNNFNYLDNNIDTKVDKDGDKVLSDNNYPDVDMIKLQGIEPGANNYSLPTASANVKGGIKVGANLSIDGSGVLSATTSAIGRYVVEVTTTSFLDPTADEDELKAIATHFAIGEQCELKVYPDDTGFHGFYIGHLTFSTGSTFKFTVYQNLGNEFYIYSINTNAGTITVSHN